MEVRAFLRSDTVDFVGLLLNLCAIEFWDGAYEMR